MAPVCTALVRSGMMEERLQRLDAHLSSCRLCHHRCGANRLAGERGFCGAGTELRVATSCVHTGEEPVLVGDSGVGNIFLGGCSLSCAFCQNWTISQPVDGVIPGEVWSAEALAERLLDFQSGGCPSVGFVTPTHFAPQIFHGVALAVRRGLSVPVIYNSSGYDTPELIRQLEGMVDIYLPDFKYWSEEYAVRYSSAPGYPAAARDCLREMYSQAGPLVTDGKGVAVSGMIVRLLVLPNMLAGTGEVLRFIASELGTDVYISLMSQYHPCHRAASGDHPLLSRGLREREYERVMDLLDGLAFARGWTQDPVSSPEHYLGPFQT